MMLPAAKVYSSLGFALFPVAGDCRKPLTEHGCKDATADLAEITRYWSRRPNTNIAVATGSRSGVFVLDIDRKDAVDGFACLETLEAAHGPLPACWVSLTPSGGEHRWFRQPAGWTLRNKVGLRIYHEDGTRTVFHGLDIRTTDGSVAVPPSAKPHGAYTWKVAPWEMPLAEAPEWLLKLGIDPPPPPKSNRPPLRMSSVDKTSRYVESAINSECRALASMSAGTGRNLKLFQAAANLAELVAANLLSEDVAKRALEEAASDCGLLQEDGAHAIRQTIASGFRRGLAKPREVRA